MLQYMIEHVSWRFGRISFCTWIGLHVSLSEFISLIVFVSHRSLLSEGSFKVMVYPTIYSLESIPEGLKEIEDRKTWGKAVVKVRNEDGSSYIETQKAKL